MEGEGADCKTLCMYLMPLNWTLKNDDSDNFHLCVFHKEKFNLIKKL